MAAIKRTGSQIWSIIHLLLLLLLLYQAGCLHASSSSFRWIPMHGAVACCSSARHSVFIICIFCTNKNYLIIVFRSAASAKSSEQCFCFVFGSIRLGATKDCDQYFSMWSYDGWKCFWFHLNGWDRNQIQQKNDEKIRHSISLCAHERKKYDAASSGQTGGVHHKFINSLYDSFGFLCEFTWILWESYIFLQINVWTEIMQYARINVIRLIWAPHRAPINGWRLHCVCEIEWIKWKNAVTKFVYRKRKNKIGQLMLTVWYTHFRRQSTFDRRNCSNVWPRQRESESGMWQWSRPKTKQKINR